MTRLVSTAGKKAREIKTQCSEAELARIGSGEICYIRMLTGAQARAQFPAMQGLPNVQLFALYAANGWPIALTDTLQAAQAHAEEGELSIVYRN